MKGFTTPHMYFPDTQEMTYFSKQRTGPTLMSTLPPERSAIKDCWVNPERTNK